MFGIGVPELIIISVVALIFIGPKNLPGVLKSIGKGIVQLKRATNEVRDTVQYEMDQIENEEEVKKFKETSKKFESDIGEVNNYIDPLNNVSNADEKNIKNAKEDELKNKI